MPTAWPTKPTWWSSATFMDRGSRSVGRGWSCWGDGTSDRVISGSMATGRGSLFKKIDLCYLAHRTHPMQPGVGRRDDGADGLLVKPFETFATLEVLQV